LQIAADFVISAVHAGDFPCDDLPEVALVGRSNVGKSSLINALARRSVARTSAAPGKTRLLNFYRVRRGQGAGLYIVDLPGYGYARGGDASSQEFNRLTGEYFSRTDRRMAAVLLVDSRHPGLESDLDAWEWLQARPHPRIVVATKADKLTRAERTRHAREFETLFDGPVALISARTGEGLDELWKTIVNLPNRTAA
jgi:GTP-binding protein